MVERKANPWFAHVKKFREMKKNQKFSYSECLKEARKTYKPVAKKEPAKNPRKKKVTGGSVKEDLEKLVEAEEPVSGGSKKGKGKKVTGGSDMDIDRTSTKRKRTKITPKLTQEDFMDIIDDSKEERKTKLPKGGSVLKAKGKKKVLK